MATGKQTGDGCDRQQTLLLPATDEEREAASARGAATSGGPPAEGRRYKRGNDLAQAMLLPPSIEDYVAKDNPVRAIKAYVQTLDMAALGFANAAGEAGAGQPAFDPRDLLALYIYGYLNRVRSSRRLHQECIRNLEVMWLLGALAPCYRVISAFRKDNADALVKTTKAFVALCRELGLVGGERVGLDGSFFNADASDASVKTAKQLRAELAAHERDIERYHQQLEASDAQAGAQAVPTHVSPEQLEEIKTRAERKRTQLKTLEERGETQLCKTDPDARRLSKSGKRTIGYNVQSVVDAKHKLIVTHAVTNDANDSEQLAAMAKRAKDVLEVDTLQVLADAGYASEAELSACEREGIEAIVPIPDKHRDMQASGRFNGTAFHYNSACDVYVCPGGQLLYPQGKPTLRSEVSMQKYASRDARCRGCALRTLCLPAKTPRRQLWRSEHADVMARHHRRMAASAALMRERAGLCEHPFGTMKRWLGWDHFLVRGFEKVRGEMALLINCYNLRRLLTLYGVEAFIELCQRSGAAGNRLLRALKTALAAAHSASLAPSALIRRLRADLAGLTRRAFRRGSGPLSAAPAGL